MLFVSYVYESCLFFIVCDVSYSIVEMQHIFCSILENHCSVQQSFFYFLGQNERYPNRVYLIYDGIHYDPLAKENSNSSGEPLKTTFSVNDDSTLMEASSLATEAREVIFLNLLFELFEASFFRGGVS